MFDFLSCGFGSVLGGLLTAIFVAGGLLVISIRNAKHNSIEPLPLVLCGVLFCLVFYQTTMIYAAIGSKGIVLDMITACHLQFGGEINGVELREQVNRLIEENPLISFFIDVTDLEDFDWSQPIKSLRSVVSREYNWYIVRRIIWSLVFIFIAIIGIMFCQNLKPQKRRHKRSFDDDRDFFQFD